VAKESSAIDYFSEAVRQSPVYFAEAERNLARVRRRRQRQMIASAFY
jgi:hypothetical protein